VDFVRPVSSVIPGAQGQILAVLAETSAELSLRALGRLSGVSVAQASRILPGLVELGIVERREVPPSSLFRLVPDHIASRAILELADARRSGLAELAQAATEMSPSPASVIVFGSLARGEADAKSDVDVVIIRPDDVGEEDERWQRSVGLLRIETRRRLGNPVEILEVSASEAARKLRGRSPLWADVRRDGVTVLGRTVEQLARGAHA
jgi:predicted nucleotidyltransferase